MPSTIRWTFLDHLAPPMTKSHIYCRNNKNKRQGTKGRTWRYLKDTSTQLMLKPTHLYFANCIGTRTKNISPPEQQKSTSHRQNTSEMNLCDQNATIAELLFFLSNLSIQSFPGNYAADSTTRFNCCKHHLPISKTTKKRTNTSLGKPFDKKNKMPITQNNFDALDNTSLLQFLHPCQKLLQFFWWSDLFKY